MSKWRPLSLLVVLFTLIPHCFGFVPQLQGIERFSALPKTARPDCPSEDPESDNNNINIHSRLEWPRRDAIAASLSVMMTGMCLSEPSLAYEENVFRPASRPTAYRVDSTIPPTLLPLETAGRQASILQKLGKGSGTDKESLVMDTINLNNMLNKAVYGTIEAVKQATGPSAANKAIGGPNYSSYVCLGVPKQTSAVDIELARSLSDTILRGRKKDTPTALGLSELPYSTQPLLSQLKRGEISLNGLKESLVTSGIPQSTVELYTPLLDLADEFKLQLIALAPEPADVETARTKGIQFVDADRRSEYVVDPQGFIDNASDSTFKMYADRSLFKDFVARNDKDLSANFLVERMLVHEAAASAVAKFGYNQADALCILVAPIPDVRFLQGLNGRIPRIVRAINPDSLVTANAVTTILCNPTALETLSKSNYLRLEVGTGPDSLNFQQKVADFLWFSKTPKVNLIPRLMNA